VTSNHPIPSDGMSPIDPTDPLASPSAPGRRSRRTLAAAATAGVLAVGGLAGVALYSGGSTTKAPTASAHKAAHGARLAASTCSGPAGAAYVVDAGWDGFTAVNTATCAVVETYNVDDTALPNDPDDSNYSSSSDAVAISGHELYFADTGNDTVAVIDAATLDPSNYNPAEKLIKVGANPEDVVVTPDGKQLWVADTGPQTDPGWKSGLTVISTATDKVTARVALAGAPTDVAISPNGKDAYVTTARGLDVYKTATRKLAYSIKGLGTPESAAVSPDGKDVYVTESASNAVAVVSTSTHRVVRTIKVGQMPWQIVFSPKGDLAYVADPDSDGIAVINTATSQVEKTFPVAGDPTSLALTADGSQLWVGQNALGNAEVLNATSGASEGTVYLGGDPQYGDGYLPTGIAITSTPPTS
jgi:YVTN family beta-propeller protein